MGVDEELLNQEGKEDNEAEEAGDLRQAQREEADTENNFKEEDNQGSFDFNSLRHRAQLASLKARTKETRSGLMISSFRKGTSLLLRQSWLNLIDSFGLTLIWINIHVVLHVVFGEKAFCKLGDEWDDLGSGVIVKRPKYLLRLGEGMGLAALDLLAILLLLTVLLIIRIIIGVMTGEVDTLKSLFSAVWDMFKAFVGLS